MIISLTGFMGCGKSSVGKKLSELLCCPFMDLDTVIEENHGRLITEIFAEDGEGAFRAIEKNELQKIICSAKETGDTHQPVEFILALGGGTVTTEGGAEIVNSETTCIYLRASVDTLLEHLSREAEKRPLLKSTEHSDPSHQLRRRIEELMAKRSTIYEKTSHVIIDTDGKSIEDIAEEIVISL